MIDEYIETFINYLEYERHYSLFTVDSYSNDLKIFINFLNVEGINKIKDIDYKIIRNYLSYLHNNNYAKTSISRNISSLRSLFKYLLRENIITSNPMTLISNPKQDKRLPHFLYYKELEELLSIPDDDASGIRDSLILELLYSTGIRVSELVNIKTKDINTHNKTIKILGKGSKERYVLYGSVCEEKMNHYLNKSRPELVKAPNDYLLLNKYGNKLTTRGIRYIIDTIIKKGALKFHISPHDLRHTFATHILNEGADLKTVQELLGHENLSTTEVYTHVSNEKLRSVYLNCHPRAKK